jgi:hypothetical protein
MIEERNLAFGFLEEMSFCPDFPAVSKNLIDLLGQTSGVRESEY